MSIRDFPPRPQGAEYESAEFQRWIDSLGDRQNIDMQVELTALAVGDEFFVLDISETSAFKLKKITVANLKSGMYPGITDASTGTTLSLAGNGNSTLGVANQLLTFTDATSSNCGFEIGIGATGSRACFIDFHSMSGAADYEARIIREGGTNSDFSFENAGTGALKFKTNATEEQVRVTRTATPSNYLTLTGGTNPTIGVSGGKLAISSALVLSQTTLLETSATLTNGAAANAGTLLNAPAVGNPTKWIPINDNGTTRYIPAW